MDPGSSPREPGPARDGDTPTIASPTAIYSVNSTERAAGNGSASLWHQHWVGLENNAGSTRQPAIHSEIPSQSRNQSKD